MSDVMVEHNERAIQAFTDLGLTLIQAKVCLALIRTGISTVRIISKASNVPRPDVYRILLQLQEVGLVNKLISNPIKYQPLSMQEALDILLERRSKKTHELIKTKNVLIKEFPDNKLETKFLEENDQFVLIPKKEVNIRRGEKEIVNSHYSIDVITSWKDFLKRIFYYREKTVHALNRGVKIRHILEKPEDEKNFTEIISHYTENPNVEVRCINKCPKAIITIFDKNRCIIKISTSKDLEESSGLWSNNPCLISIVKDYFEILWITAIEINNGLP